MSWITWMAMLLAWSLAGVAIAYLFGRFTQRGEFGEEAAEPLPQGVSDLRRAKRARGASRAEARTKVRREATGGHHVH